MAAATDACQHKLTSTTARPAQDNRPTQQGQARPAGQAKHASSERSMCSLRCCQAIQLHAHHLALHHCLCDA